MIQNSSPIRFAGSTKSDTKIWCPATIQLSTWQRSSKASTSTMYLANRMHMQMHWHPSPLHWLLQLERQKKYTSTTVTYATRNSPLKIVRLQKKVSSQWGFWDFNRSKTQGLVILIQRLCLIRHIARCPKKAAAIRKKSSSVLLQCDVEIASEDESSGLMLCPRGDEIVRGGWRGGERSSLLVLCLMSR